MTPMKPFYRYDLKVEIPATEVAVLVDALAGEAFSIRDRLGKDELERQLEAHQIEIEVLSDESWPDFQRDIETLSRYLAEPISGRELYVAPGTDGPLTEGWVILGRRGETERMELDLAWDADAMVVVDGGIDKAKAQRRWHELPAWVRSSIALVSPARLENAAQPHAGRD